MENTNTRRVVWHRAIHRSTLLALIVIGGARVGEAATSSRRRARSSDGAPTRRFASATRASRAPTPSFAVVDGGRVSVHDLGSTNGTFSNQRCAPGTRALADEDKLTFGGATLLGVHAPR